MKKLLPLLYLLALLLTTCKKDYPDDIPEWVKIKIKECKKNSCCSEFGGLEIIEYKNNDDQSIIYLFDKKISRDCNNYYDYNGNILCTHNLVVCFGNDSCGNIPFNKIIFSREIWREYSNKCE